MNAPRRPVLSPSATDGISSLQVNPGSPQSPSTGHVPSRQDAVSPRLEANISSSQTSFADDEKIHKVDETPSFQNHFTIDPYGPLTFDKTTVDVVAVPCPGGHPLRSWARDGLLGRHFGALSMRDAEVRPDNDSRPSPSWVRQGIRREADRARILLYEHPEVVDGETTLDMLAQALLRELQSQRDSEDCGSRPLLFIGHSIGGLVVKMALAAASHDSQYESLLNACYGVAFFGTPHQGSSYFAMPNLAASIQALLQLSTPLPPSITDDLRVGNVVLTRADDEFRAVSNDMLVWTFYETIDSRLSGGTSTKVAGSHSHDMGFTAPLTSVKSAILGMRQESIFPLQSDHANMASFGRNNVHTLRVFLKQLAAQINRADANWAEANDTGTWALDVEQKVNVEVHGFYNGPPSVGEELSTTRTWSTRLPLREFLAKGPDRCLNDRISELERTPERGRIPSTGGELPGFPGSGRASVRVPFTQGMAPLTVQNALGIQDRQRVISIASTPGSPILRPVDEVHAHPSRHSAPMVTPLRPMTPPSRAISPRSSPMQSPSPLIRADFEQDLALDRLSPPLRGRARRSISRSFSLGSDGSHFEYRDFPPFSQRSRSAVDEAVAGDADDLDASPRLPQSVIAMRKVATAARHRTSESVIIDEVPTALSRSELQNRKFAWVHLPFNNPTWVKKVLQTLEKADKKDYSNLYGQEFWMTRHTRGRHAQHYAYHAKPGCYFSAPRTMTPRRSSLNSPTLSPAVAGADSMFTCLFLPYLHFDSYKRLIRRRKLIIDRLSSGRSRPVPELVAKSSSLELQVLWEYLGHDPPINCRRTLDQYEYPSLRDTRSRDDDQMLYKLTKERACERDSQSNLFLYSQGSGTEEMSQESTGPSQHSSGGSTWRERLMGKDINDAEDQNVANGNVLMVDQLWLWVIQSHTILTFFPKRESDPIEGPLYQQADLRDSIVNEVNVDLTRQCENAFDLAALSALHAISVLLDRSSHPDLEVFRIFEEAISVLTERLTSSLKDFRAEGFRDKAFDYEPVENKARSIRKRHKEEGRRAERENRDNTSALLELRDIEDELQTLLHLFERQSKVISSMASIYSRPELREKTANGRIFLSEALKKLREYAQTANEMMQRVRTTRDDYEKLLQMVQRQAQVDEVRLSRLHADLASAQSRSVMIFTTFTVIFLPLTFFTGLFGMNTHEWGGENNLPLRTIGMISLPSSAFLVVSSLVIAFSTNARRLCTWFDKKYRHAIRWAYHVVWVPLFIAAVDLGMRAIPMRKKAGDEREGARKKKGMESDASDFWERHRMERDKGYRIPAANKKKGDSGAESGGLRVRSAASKGKKEKSVAK